MPVDNLKLNNGKYHRTAGLSSDDRITNIALHGKKSVITPSVGKKRR